jgi:hypothetical protein
VRAVTLGRERPNLSAASQGARAHTIRSVRRHVARVARPRDSNARASSSGSSAGGASLKGSDVGAPASAQCQMRRAEGIERKSAGAAATAGRCSISFSNRPRSRLSSKKFRHGRSRASRDRNLDQGCVETAPGPERAIKGSRYSLAFAIKVALDKVPRPYPTRAAAAHPRASWAGTCSKLCELQIAVRSSCRGSWPLSPPTRRRGSRRKSPRQDAQSTADLGHSLCAATRHEQLPQGRLTKSERYGCDRIRPQFDRISRDL